MSRLPRLVAPGLPHHLIQRGNNRQAIFVDATDCGRFVGDLARLAGEHGLAIHAYVLMPNHVHLLATPASRESMSRVMQALGRCYVRWFNARHGRTGTLWEGRYRSTVVETDRYLLACMRYLDMNPVRSGLVDDPGAYRWSSHRHYLGLAVDALVTEHPAYWALGNTPFERQMAYRRMFDATPPAGEIDAIRAATQRGWALGEGDFLRDVESAGGRRARPLRSGRPRKTGA